MEIIKKMPLSECRICLGEYDESSMRMLFADGGVDLENDIPDGTEEENEDAAANLRLNSEIEFCCGIRASHNSFTSYLYSIPFSILVQVRQSLQLPSKVCERCCEFVRMWKSFRQMCLNSQVYLEITYLPDEKPDELIDASDSAYMEYLFETLQLQRPTEYRTHEEEQQDQRSEIEGDYVVDFGDEDFMTVGDGSTADEEEEHSKQKLNDMITELESYEDVDDADADNGDENVDEPIKVDASLIYADDSQIAEDEPPLKDEQDDMDDYGMENEDFLSPTPSPDPKPSTAVKRKPGRPRKPDNELKTKRKTKSEQHLKLEPHVESSSPRYMCNLCGNVYPKKAAFTAHMMAHTDYKPHQCE